VFRPRSGGVGPSKLARAGRRRGRRAACRRLQGCSSLAVLATSVTDVGVGAERGRSQRPRHGRRRWRPSPTGLPRPSRTEPQNEEDRVAARSCVCGFAAR